MRGAFASPLSRVPLLAAPFTLALVAFVFNLAALGGPLGRLTATALDPFNIFVGVLAGLILFIRSYPLFLFSALATVAAYVFLWLEPAIDENRRLLGLGSTSDAALIAHGFAVLWYAHASNVLILALIRARQTK